MAYCHFGCDMRQLKKKKKKNKTLQPISGNFYSSLVQTSGHVCFVLKQSNPLRGEATFYY
jgi:hypothetical protein